MQEERMIKSDIFEQDPAIYDILQREFKRQQNSIELIASENFVSPAVLAAQGSVLTNKYAEGYPGKRFYSGCDVVDEAEVLAIERAKKLFNCNYANVQPHSGSQANQVVYFALLQPGDTILGMSLNSGGHLTHGATPNVSGKWFNAIAYDVDPQTFLIDYDKIEALAKLHKPKMIIAGFSCYTHPLDFKKFRQIADSVGAYLLADIAHISGLVATGLHPSPFPHCHVATSTTHKTLRGPRGGIILSSNEDIAKMIDSSLFPGIQGGPLMHIVAAKAVAFLEALQPSFKDYIKQVVLNADALAGALMNRGHNVLTGKTTNHIVILDLRSSDITGKLATDTLDHALITCNKNAIPFDDKSPFITSGLRLGTPACTTRGFKEKEFVQVAGLVADVLDALVKKGDINEVTISTKKMVKSLLERFPLYDNVDDQQL
jgi:glycine hydroxymethyltransferase